MHEIEQTYCRTFTQGYLAGLRSQGIEPKGEEYADEAAAAWLQSRSAQAFDGVSGPNALTFGWAMAFAAQLVEKGHDIRELEIPAMWEQCKADFKAVENETG